jgi:hypothetical protein
MMKRRLAQIGVAFAALISIAAVAAPADAGDYYRHRSNGSFSLEFSTPGYYYAPAPRYYYAPAPRYYYAPAPRYYYAPPPAYYYPPPPPPRYYYEPGPSFNFGLGFGTNR